MGLGLTNQLHHDASNGIKKLWGAPHFHSHASYQVRRGCNSQIRVLMLEDLVVFCNQSIHTRFRHHPDIMQDSTEFIRHLHLNFQQSDSTLPTAFMTSCSSGKSWLNAETWLDDRLGPCKHISLVTQSHIFISGISARVGEQHHHVATCFLGSNSLFCNSTT